MIYCREVVFLNNNDNNMYMSCLYNEIIFIVIIVYIILGYKLLLLKMDFYG